MEVHGAVHVVVRAAVRVEDRGEDHEVDHVVDHAADQVDPVDVVLDVDEAVLAGRTQDLHEEPVHLEVLEVVPVAVLHVPEVVLLDLTMNLINATPKQFYNASRNHVHLITESKIFIIFVTIKMQSSSNSII